MSPTTEPSGLEPSWCLAASTTGLHAGGLRTGRWPTGRRDQGGWLVGLGLGGVGLGWLVICPLGGWLSVIDFIFFTWDFGTKYLKNDEVINVCSRQIIN